MGNPADELAKLQKETELYGLSERAIASRTVAPFEDAIATRARTALMKIRWPIWNAELRVAQGDCRPDRPKKVASILAQTPSAKEAQTASKSRPRPCAGKQRNPTAAAMH